MTSDIAIGLGSNVGERRVHLAAALRALDSELEGMAVSSLWETRPVEVDGEQPDYLNLCVAGKTGRTAAELLSYCQELERRAGREPDTHGLPRTLDLDLLYHAGGVQRDRQLTVPHPGMARRGFVLAPLAEIRPHWRHPGSGRSVGEMLAALTAHGAAEGLSRLDEEGGWWR